MYETTYRKNVDASDADEPKLKSDRGKLGRLLMDNNLPLFAKLYYRTTSEAEPAAAARPRTPVPSATSGSDDVHFEIESEASSESEYAESEKMDELYLYKIITTNCLLARCFRKSFENFPIVNAVANRLDLPEEEETEGKSSSGSSTVVAIPFAYQGLFELLNVDSIAAPPRLEHETDAFALMSRLKRPRNFFIAKEMRVFEIAEQASSQGPFSARLERTWTVMKKGIVCKAIRPLLIEYEDAETTSTPPANESLWTKLKRLLCCEMVRAKTSTQAVIEFRLVEDFRELIKLETDSISAGGSSSDPLPIQHDILTKIPKIKLGSFAGRLGDHEASYDPNFLSEKCFYLPISEAGPTNSIDLVPISALMNNKLLPSTLSPVGLIREQRPRALKLNQLQIVNNLLDRNLSDANTVSCRLVAEHAIASPHGDFLDDGGGGGELDETRTLDEVISEIYTDDDDYLSIGDDQIQSYDHRLAQSRRKVRSIAATADVNKYNSMLEIFEEKRNYQLAVGFSLKTKRIVLLPVMPVPESGAEETTEPSIADAKRDPKRFVKMSEAEIEQSVLVRRFKLNDNFTSFVEAANLCLRRFDRKLSRIEVFDRLSMELYERAERPKPALSAQVNLVADLVVDRHRSEALQQQCRVQSGTSMNLNELFDPTSYSDVAATNTSTSMTSLGAYERGVANLSLKTSDDTTTSNAVMSMNHSSSSASCQPFMSDSKSKSCELDEDDDIGEENLSCYETAVVDTPSPASQKPSVAIVDLDLDIGNCDTNLSDDSDKAPVVEEEENDSKENNGDEEDEAAGEAKPAVKRTRYKKKSDYKTYPFKAASKIRAEAASYKRMSEETEAPAEPSRAEEHHSQQSQQQQASKPSSSSAVQKAEKKDLAGVDEFMMRLLSTTSSSSSTDLDAREMSSAARSATERRIKERNRKALSTGSAGGKKAAAAAAARKALKSDSDTDSDLMTAPRELSAVLAHHSGGAGESDEEVPFGREVFVDDDDFNHSKHLLELVHNVADSSSASSTAASKQQQQQQLRAVRAATRNDTEDDEGYSTRVRSRSLPSEQTNSSGEQLFEQRVN